MQGQEIWGIFEKIRHRIPQGFWLLLVLGLAYALPIMLDGRYYLDDLSRAMTGLTLWEKEGRPLASILSSIISFSWPSFEGPALRDTSPVPQILGVVALAYGAALLAGKLFPDGVGLTQVLVVFPVIGSPFMLQNLSYKYDALTMGLAAMLALIAAATEASWLVCALLLLSLLLYQAAFNVFIAAAALNWLATVKQDRNGDRSFLKKLAWGVAALFLYNLVIKFFINISGDYAAQHSAIIPFEPRGLVAVQNNFGFGIFFVIQVLEDAPLLAIGIAAAIIARAVQLAPANSGTGGNPLARFILTLIIIVCSVMGALLFLQSPVVRPRTLMGFSIFLVFAGYCTHEWLKSWPGVRIAALGAATVWFFALANIYANAARDETRFDRDLSISIIEDLRQAGFRPGGKLVFDGVQPLSPLAEHATRLKIIAHVLQPNMNGNSEWGFGQLAFFGLESTPITDATDDSLKALCADGPGITKPQYQIFSHGETMLVAFPQGKCFRG